MPTGKSDIPDLRLERLTKLITSWLTAPNLVLMKMFGEITAESDVIKWEAQVGNRGMTPFAAPGAPSPSVAPVGLSQHSAMAAYWKEKIYFDEVFLNNLRQEGTTATYLTAQQRLARETLMLRNRCDRRKEWMYAQMLSGGSFSYSADSGIKISVDYGVPSANLVTLAANRYWDSGSQRNIIEDIMDGKIAIQNAISAQLDWAMCTTEILKLLILDRGIQTLLQKSAFGDGALFANPVMVLKSLLGIPNLMIYDEAYVVTAWITTKVTGASTTTVYVDDASDFVAGGTLRFHDVSANTYEDETITSVDVEAGTILVSSAPTASFKANEDKVTMTRKFLPTNKFCMFASTVDGQKIAEFMKAPYGLDRSYGMQVDTHQEWDPDGVWVRVQNKGLPVLYNKDAIYNLTVTA
jgi:hypothetical protein